MLPEVMSRAAVVLCASGCVCGSAQPVIGPSGYRPSAAEREVRVFDFEEQRTNPLPVPIGWFRAQDDPVLPRERPGYPIYNAAELDYTSPARSGTGSVRIPTNGGSTSLRLKPGVVSIFPAADYRVVAHVRAEGIEHASFQLRARFLDQRGQTIEGSEVTAPLAPPTDEWVEVRLTAMGLFADAAYMQLDLELVQPRQHQDMVLGEHHIWEDDLSGSFFVDDVSVVQLPRVELRADEPANVFEAPTPPELTLLVRDLTAENLTAEVVVVDSFGRVVDRHTRPIFSASAPMRIRPDVSAFGWYRAHVSVRSDQGEVARDACSFLVVPEVVDGPDVVSCQSRPDDRRRFGLVVDGLRAEMVPSLPEVIRRARVGGVSLGVWGHDPIAAVDEVTDRFGLLDAGWQEVTIGFDAIPAGGVLGHRRSDELLDLLGDSSEESLLDPYVLPLIDQLGQSVSRWRIGSISEPMTFFEPELSSLLSRASARLSALVPGPELVLPWRPEFEPTVLGGLPGLGGVSVLFEGASGVSVFEAFASRWSELELGGVDMTYVFAPASVGQGGARFGPRVSSSELVKRAVLYWVQHASESDDEGGCPDVFLSLSEPWGWSGGRRPQPVPSPELAAWRSVIDRLAERRVVGEMRVGPGVRCWVLAPAAHAAPERGGALVAWAEGVSGSHIRQFLGDGEIRVYDIFGNASDPVLTSSWSEEDPVSAQVEIHRIPVGSEPVFVEGIDVNLASFVGSFRLEPGFLESGYEEHEATIAFDNPWGGSITGSVGVVSPGGGVGADRDRTWTFTPRVSRFSVAARRSASLPVRVSFSPVEEAGVRDLVADVDLIAPGLQRRLRVVSTFEVGLENIELDVKYYPVAGTPDAVLEAVVTNTGETPRSLRLVANAPGFPRLRASIDELAPGVSVVRRFRLELAESRLDGDRIFVGAIDRDRGARLNRVVRTR